MIDPSHLSPSQFVDDSIWCAPCRKPVVQNAKAQEILMCMSCGNVATTPEEAQSMFVAAGLPDLTKLSQTQATA